MASNLWKITITIVATLVFYASGFGQTSEPPSPAPFKTAKQKQSDPTQRSENAGVSNRQTTTSSSVIEISPSSILQVESSEKEEKRHGYSSAEWGLVWVTIALALITAALAFYTARLYRATVKLGRDAKETSERQASDMGRFLKLTEKQAELAREQHELQRWQFLNTHRPRLIIRGISLVDGDGDYFKRGSKNPEIQFEIINIGGSKATIIKSNATFAQIDDPFPPIPPYSQDNNTIKHTIREAGQSTAPETLEINNFEIGRIVNSWKGKTITNGDKSLFYFLGYVHYADDIGNERRMAFCRRYNPATKRFIAIEDPAYEYTD